MPITITIMRINIKKLFYIYIFICLAQLFTVSQSFSNQKNQSVFIEKKNVLVLHSYSDDFEWTNDIMQALRNSLVSSNLSIEIFVEYLDTKRFPDRNYWQHLFNTFDTKYQETSINLIITSDNNALEFLFQYRDLFYPKVPVVFCGLNNYKPEMIEKQKRVTGIAESTDLKATIDLSLQLHPETKKLVFIASSARSSILNLKQLEDVRSSLESNLAIEIWKDKPIEEIEKLTHQLESHSILFIIGRSRNSQGEYLNTDQMGYRVSIASSVPIYSLWNFYLGTGIIGGKLVYGKDQGRVAGELALKILNGVPVDEIPVITETPTSYMFDYLQLKHFGITLDALPNNSIVINKPYSFYEANKKVVWVTIVIFAIFTTLTTFLAFNIFRRLRVEKELRRHRDHLEVLVEERTIKIKKTQKLLLDSKELLDTTGEIANVGGWELDAKTSEVKWTEQTYRIHELPSDQKLPLGEVINFFHLDDREKLSAAIQRALDNGDPYDMDVRLITAKGRKIWTRTVCNPQIINGKVSKLKGIFHDITDRKLMEDALRDSKESLHDLLQNIQAGVVVHGPDTKIKDCNKVALDLLGLTKDQMFGGKAIDRSWKFYNEDDSDMPPERYPANQVITSKNKVKNMIVGICRPDKNDIIKVLTNAVPEFDSDGNIFEVIVTFVNITERIQAEKAREKILKSLQEALDNVKTLSGLVPICSNCKKIRDDEGYWNQIEGYIQKHTSAEFSHGICPECSDELYGKEDWYIEMKKEGNQKK